MGAAAVVGAGVAAPPAAAVVDEAADVVDAAVVVPARSGKQAAQSYSLVVLKNRRTIKHLHKVPGGIGTPASVHWCLQASLHLNEAL